MDVEKTINFILDLQAKSQQKHIEIEGYLAEVARLQAVAEKRMDRAEALMGRADDRMDRAEARMEKFDKRLEATRKLVEFGMKLVVRSEQRLDRLERLMKASIKGRGNGNG